MCKLLTGMPLAMHQHAGQVDSGQHVPLFAGSVQMGVRQFVIAVVVEFVPQKIQHAQAVGSKGFALFRGQQQQSFGFFDVGLNRVHPPQREGPEQRHALRLGAGDDRGGGGGRAWCSTGRLGLCCFVLDSGAFVFWIPVWFGSTGGFVGSGAFFVRIPAIAVTTLHAFPQQRHPFCFVHGKTTRPGRVALRKHDNVVMMFVLLLLLLCSTGKHHDRSTRGALLLLLLLLPGQRVTLLVPFTGLFLVQGMAVPSVVFRTGDLLRQLNHGTAHQTLLLHRRRTGHQFFQLLFQLMKLCFGGLAIVFVVGVMGGQLPFVVNWDPCLVFGHAGQDVFRCIIGGLCQMVVVQLGVLDKGAVGMCYHLSWKPASLVCMAKR